MNRPSYKEIWLYERKDREEQLQWIRDAVDGNAKFYNSEPPYSEEEELARKIMQMHARIAELEAAQRWIPVSERLPENENDQVLIRSGNVVALGWIYFDELMGDWDYRCYDEDWGGYPTHWMPLPKLPEVQE